MASSELPDEQLPQSETPHKTSPGSCDREARRAAGKVAAIYGLGDQKKYPDEFVDAIGIIHDALVAAGARVVGRWPIAAYEFAASQAVDGEHFLGLALDQINQPVLTEERIDTWLAQIRPELLP